MARVGGKHTVLIHSSKCPRHVVLSLSLVLLPLHYFQMAELWHLALSPSVLCACAFACMRVCMCVHVEVQR